MRSEMGVYSERTLLRLIEHIYDAALAPELWPTFLDALADAMKAHTANIGFISTTDSPTIACAVRFDPEANRKYEEYYARLDPWEIAATRRGLVRTGVVALGDALVPRSEYEKTEFYNDFARAYAFVGGVAAVIRADSSQSALLNVMHRKEGPEFTEREVALLKRLLPHLQRAFDVHQRFDGLVRARGAAEEVIDRMPIGVVLVDASARPFLTNRAAHQILDSRDGLMLRDRMLVTAKPAQTAELRKLVITAIAASRGERLLEAGGAISIRRPSMKRPLQVLVTPLRWTEPKLLSTVRPCAAIFISDPEVQPLADEMILRQFFGLTPAEARVARELVAGHNVKELSSVLALTENTVRTYVKTILAKTGCRSQSALVAVLLRSVAAVRNR